MIDQLEQLGKQALQGIEGASSLDTLEQLRVSVLGKKGSLSEVLRGMGALSAEERPKVGAAANLWKQKIETALDAKIASFQGQVLAQKLEKEKIDVTLPPRLLHRGTIHPITQTTELTVSILRRIGFEVTSGPEVETEYLCFDAVNTPQDHPARDMQDTFYLSSGVLLRTHTTPVQMRTLLARKPPIRILSPGTVYRCDDDATHSPMFHQIEGLWIDQGVTMADMKGVLQYLARELFGSATQLRMRPSFFPFVEPGAEVDVSCFRCKKGPEPTCRICKGTGWFEILGAGMVHPNLFREAGHDPKRWSGFAFGTGVDRIAMLLHQIPHIKHLYQPDMRFLSQF